MFYNSSTGYLKKINDPFLAQTLKTAILIVDKNYYFEMDFFRSVKNRRTCHIFSFSRKVKKRRKVDETRDKIGLNRDSCSWRSRTLTRCGGSKIVGLAKIIPRFVRVVPLSLNFSAAYSAKQEAGDQRKADVFKSIWDCIEVAKHTPKIVAFMVP